MKEEKEIEKTTVRTVRTFPISGGSHVFDIQIFGRVMDLRDTSDSGISHIDEIEGSYDDHDYKAENIMGNIHIQISPNEEGEMELVLFTDVQ